MSEFRNHQLLYNAAAHFTANERFPDGVANAIKNDLGALCWILAELSTQAEAYNRYMSRDAKPPLDEKELLLSITPYELLEAKTAVLSAVTHGLSGDKNDENEEIDEVLAELQKKTATSLRKRNT